MVKIHTNKGVITVALDVEKAPQTVANFLQYAKDGFYEGTLFHRVIPGFMVQGGGLDKEMNNKPTRAPISNEATNGLKNEIGTLAMARTNDPHSATAQFFINVAKNDFLNHTQPAGTGWGYAVFGQVTDGMDVVNSIAAVPTGSAGHHQDVPVDPVIIEKVEIIE